MVRVVFDRKVSLEVAPGTLLIDAAKEAGIYIPTLCYLPQKLEPQTPCGVCVVEIRGKGLQRACAYVVREDIEVSTKSEEISRIRQSILEGLVKNHYGDCNAPCHTPCPGNLPIQGYIGFIAQGDFKAALALIKEKLPLPATVGRVCPRFCESVCRRVLLDEPVAINNLKRFVADYGLQYGELTPKPKPFNGKKVAVIGAGPAGLACAYFLRLQGVGVRVFDKNSHPGGLLAYGIPNFKLPKDVLEREIKQIWNLGVEFVPKQEWGRDFNLEDLFKQGYRAVFLATGLSQEKLMGFAGEDLALSGLEFLKKVNQSELELIDFQGKNIAILGGSYTALEVARILRRVKARVELIFPRSRLELPVPVREIHYAEQEGVGFCLVTMPVKLERKGKSFVLETVKTVLGPKKELFLTEHRETREFDLIFRAWGESLDQGFQDFGQLESRLYFKTSGFLKTDSFGATSVQGVFAGGDMVNGPKTVIHAVSSGRKAAYGIVSFLQSERKPTKTVSFKYDFSRGKRLETVDSNLFTGIDLAKRSRLKERSPQERLEDFKEITLGLTSDEAIAEAKRCLQCGCIGISKCNFRDVLMQERVEAKSGRKQIKYLIKRDHPVLELDLNKCIGCERCVRTCSYAAIELKILNKNTLHEHISFNFNENCTCCGDCADACPTGALVKKHLRVPYERNKDEVKAVKSICGYCGVGCNLTVWVKHNAILEITGQNNSPNYGSLCIKGRFGFDFYKSSKRLLHPRLRSAKDKSLEVVDWDQALEFLAERFAFYRDQFGPQSIGVLASSQISNEESYLAHKLAREVFQTNNIDCAARV